VQHVFLVIIEWTPPRLPLVGSGLHRRDAISRILQVTPAAAWTMVQLCSDLCQRITELIGAADAATGAEHVAEIRSQAFVDPQQIGLHGLFVIRSGQVGWATILTVPGMHVCMREEAGFDQAQAIIDQSAVIAPAVVRLMVTQSQVRHMMSYGER